MFGTFIIRCVWNLLILQGTLWYFLVLLTAICCDESKCLAGLCSLLVTHIWQVAAGRFSEGTKEGEGVEKKYQGEKRGETNVKGIF